MRSLLLLDLCPLSTEYQSTLSLQIIAAIACEKQPNKLQK